MELTDLLNKAQTEQLSLEEQQEFFVMLNQQMTALKESDPVQYLALLKQLNGIIEGLNKDLKNI